MARKRRKIKRQKKGTTYPTSLPSNRRLPRLGDIQIPKEGLLDPSLRRDIGSIPGLAPAK